MAEENTEIVRRAVDAWNRRDADLALSLVDPEIEVEVAIGSLIDGTYHGLTELAEFMGDFWGGFGDYRSELVECRAIGEDQVLLTVRHIGTGRASGVEVEMPGWQAFTLRSGKILRWRNFSTRAQAAEAVGISE